MSQKEEHGEVESR